jgi:type VI secretion system protein ImpC
MPKPLPFGHVGIELTSNLEPSGRSPRDEISFRMLLLGDWSGRTNRRLAPSRLANLRPVRVDRDNLEEVLKKAGAELHLAAGQSDDRPLTIRFTELDDFHPDRLFQRVEVFQALRNLRERLGDPTSFAAGAEELRSWKAGAGSPEPPAVNPENVLEQILGGPISAPRPSESVSDAGSLQAVIRNIVQPYLAPQIDYAKQAELMALVDNAIGAQMRAVLHHPDFQTLESAWRGLHFLIRRLDTDVDLQVFILDTTKDELAADLSSADDLRSTGLYRLLVEQTVGTPGALPWSAVFGHYTFDHRRTDVAILGRLAKVVRPARAPFIAAASGRLLGCASLAATPDPDDWRSPIDPHEAADWDDLRRLPEASSIGLALPRFLLRLPYGKETSPTEQFDFEEMPAGSQHEDYLWGHPAIACGFLIGRAFNRNGSSLDLDILQEIDGLPVHVYQEAGESRLKPCAEIVLVERAIEAIRAKGLMPLLSIPGRDAVQLAGFTSLANPARPLAGRWEHS